MNPNTTYTPLTRSQDNHLIAGVCSGIAKVFNIDPSWIRIAFLISLFLFKFTLVIYLLLWIYLPRATKHQASIGPQTQTLPTPDHQEPAILMAPAIPTTLEDIDHPLPPLAELLQDHTVDTSSQKINLEQPVPVETSTYNNPETSDLLTAFENDMTTPSNDTTMNRTQATSFEEFPSDFLASFDDETTNTQDNVTRILDTSDKSTAFEEFPSDFLASFDGETSSTQDNVTRIPNTSDKPIAFEGFPSDFLTSFDDETTSTQDNVTRIPDTSDKSTAFEEFPGDFLASFDDASKTTLDNTIPHTGPSKQSSTFEEFPADFLDSFKDEQD